VTLSHKTIFSILNVNNSHFTHNSTVLYIGKDICRCCLIATWNHPSIIGRWDVITWGDKGFSIFIGTVTPGTEVFLLNCCVLSVDVFPNSIILGIYLWRIWQPFYEFNKFYVNYIRHFHSVENINIKIIISTIKMKILCSVTIQCYWIKELCAYVIIFYTTRTTIIIKTNKKNKHIRGF
jgi:hypothetical protein